jgi:trehalose 6-phosphate phosphatase
MNALHISMPARSVCFFLDIDGTLIDFSLRPDIVRIPPVVKAIMSQLLSVTDGGVALISGRSMADIDGLFAPLKIAAAGQHGIERRDGQGRLHGNDSYSARLAETAEKLRSLTIRYRGLLLEDKGSSLALHYRLAPDLSDLVNDMMYRLTDELGEGFEMLPGKMVAEIKPNEKNKGTAIAEFMGEEPFSGRIPVFIGDDTTDECGFSVVNRQGGHSVKVGGGPSAACWRLADSQAVRIWLSKFISANSKVAGQAAGRG